MATTSVVADGRMSAGSVQRIAVEDLGAHLATLEAELSEGRSIELVRGETVVAEVRAKEVPVARERPPLPDFMARMKKMFGDEPLDRDTTAWIRQDRDGRD